LSVAMLALVLIAPLIYLPGWALGRWLAASAEADGQLERIFERVLLGTLLNGWLALLLAELAIFSIWLHIALLTMLVGGLWWWRRAKPLPQATPAVPASQPFPTPCNHSRMAQFTTLGLLLILAISMIGVAARPFETVLGVRDAGVYANAGLALARTGSLAQFDQIVAQIEADQASSDPALKAAADQAETNFLGVQPRQRTIATRLRQAGFFIQEGDIATGRVVPQGFHLFPVWIGLMASLGGPLGGLAATGLLGVLGIWSVAMLGRRLAGPWIGLLAALLLATNGVQVWFSRYSTAEAIAQFLTFAGLYAFAAMHQRHKPQLAALLAGLSFGQLALTRIDFFLVAAPVLIYLFYMWLTRRGGSSQRWLGLGLWAMLIHAAVHIVLFARAYFFDTLFARLQDYALTALIALPFLTQPLRDVYLLRPCSRIAIQPCPPVKDMPPTTFTDWNYPRIAAEIIIVLVFILALLAVRRWGQPLIRRAEQLVVRFAGPLLGLMAVTIGLVASYTYLIRPQILSRAAIVAIPSCLTPTNLRAPEGPCLALQGYIGAPIDAPAYIDPLMASIVNLPRQLSGRMNMSLAACAELRASILPPDANRRTSVELRSDGLVSEAQLGAERWAQLQACDPYVLRDLFANSQANLVRIGWYLSPLGVVLAVIGLALWWRQLNAASWLFLVVVLIGGAVFIRLTYGTSDQHYIYILRRYIPQVYPAFALGIAYALVRLALLASGRLAWISRGIALLLTIGLLGFNLATNLKIYTHTEYAGALDQIGAIAAQIEPDAVVLLRGGAPTFASARDIPDNLATPLIYAFGRNAFTIKSAQPGNYAEQLATYIGHWQATGRPVYLLVGASGAVGLPGYTLEAIGPAELSLREFEQPTNQKPTNVQEYALSMRLYRVVATSQPQAFTAITADDYASQVSGFYRAEQLQGQQLAWTNGDALIRLPWPNQPISLTIQLAAGETRPARLGPPQVCLSYRPEPRPWPEDPNAPAFVGEQCFRIEPTLNTYQFTIDPRGMAVPANQTLVLRIQSDTWIPIRDDPTQRDVRRLGVLVGEIRQ
jgi:hypothetical protein